MVIPHRQRSVDMQVRRHLMAGVVVDIKMKSDNKNQALEAAIGQIE